MWLLAVGTFLTVVAVVRAWTPVAVADGPTSPPRAPGHGEGRWERLRVRLAIPLRTADCLLALLVVTGAVGGLTALVSGSAGAGLLAGLAVPVVVAVLLRRQLVVGQVRLAAQLPDALMMMANALKAGHTLGHAFQTLAREMPAPLGPAFERLDRALQMGQSPEAALQAFRENLASAEVDMVVQAIRIQRETGGNLVDILTNIQATLRARLKLQGKVRALTAQGKLSGLVVGLLPVALFLFLWTTSRSYLQPFLLDPLGQQALAVALGAQITGFVLIHRIVSFPI